MPLVLGIWHHMTERDVAIGEIMNETSFQGLSEAEKAATLWGRVITFSTP